MNEWLHRWHKLKFKLTPPRWRSPFCKDDPWLAKYEIGDWTYGHPKVLDWGTGAVLSIGRFCSIAGGVTIFVDGEHHTEWVSTFPFSDLVCEAKHTAPWVASRGNVIVGNDVWICEGAVILSGVRIGNGGVVGARSRHRAGPDRGGQPDDDRDRRSELEGPGGRHSGLPDD